MALRFTLRQLEYLVAVGEAGSIAQASEMVNVSPPSISASITQLEEEFGVKMFVRRHSHGLSLTAGGRRFYNAAKQILEQTEGLRDIAADIAEQVRGPLNVGCFITFAQLILPDLRRKFEAVYPEVRIHQFVAHQAELLEKLMRGEIDVALTYDLEITPEINFTPLVSLPPYVMLAPDHPLAGKDSLTLKALSEEPMILLDLPMSREYFLSIFQTAGIKPHVSEHSADMAVIRSMVANGFGYSLANVKARSTIAPDGKAVVHIPLKGDFRPMEIGVAVPASTFMARTVSAFMEHCVKEITSDLMVAQH